MFNSAKVALLFLNDSVLNNKCRNILIFRNVNTIQNTWKIFLRDNRLIKRKAKLYGPDFISRWTVNSIGDGKILRDRKERGTRTRRRGWNGLSELFRPVIGTYAAYGITPALVGRACSPPFCTRSAIKPASISRVGPGNFATI